MLRMGDHECGVLLGSDPSGVSSRLETINMNLLRQKQPYSCAPAFNLHLLPITLSKPGNIMSTNNSEENEINEGCNCVWNCNYCYHTLLSQGFSVARCANGKDCHCLSGLDQPHSELPALSTCNYWFLLTNHSWSREIKGNLRLRSVEMTHAAFR